MSPLRVGGAGALAWARAVKILHKALLPTFEDEDDDNSESKIDVGVDQEEWRLQGSVSVMWNLVKTIK